MIIGTVPHEVWQAIIIVVVVWTVLAIGEGRHG